VILISGGGNVMKENNKFSRRRFLKTAMGSAAALTFGRMAFPGKSYSKGPIKIGFSASLTGKYAWTGNRMYEGIKTWATLINKRGYSSGLEKYGHKGAGLMDGRPVELIHYDDKSDPATGVKLYQKLIFQDKVDLCFGPYSSAVTKAISPVVERAQMPTITAGASDPAIWKGQHLQWVVQTVPPTDEYLPGAAEIASKGGAKTGAIIFEDTAFPIALANSFKTQLEKRGMKVLLFEAYPKGITDWTPPLRKAWGFKPDVIGIGGYEPDAIGLTKAAEDLKVTPKLFVWTVGTGAPSYVESVGKSCRAMTGESFWEGIMDTPGNKDFVKAVQEIIGTPPEKLEYHTTMGMQAGQILEIAVKKAGTVQNKKAIRDMLYSMEVETCMGNYRVEPLSSKDSGFQIAAKCVLIQWQKKKPGEKLPYAQVAVGDWVKEVVWPDKYKTAAPIYPFPGWE
jgi:branched-chain amino acid transport system substrate-binding protein